MAENVQNTQENIQQQPSDKEINLVRMRAKYENELATERARSEEMQKQINVLNQKQAPQDEDDEDSEPYVDHKRLTKKLNKFGLSTQSEIQKAMQSAKELAKEELKQELFLENHPDFHNVLEHAERFAERSPKLAENILKMPAGFDRQKLVYHTIKELGLDKPAIKESSIQEKIDANRKGPYYQPSGVGAAPYHSASDFSASGQKNAYDKMKELQSRLRL